MIKDNCKRPVVYSLGRLIARSKNTTPSGIDRLDLQYAKYFLEEKKNHRKVIFVLQRENLMVKLDDSLASSVIQFLDFKWGKLNSEGDVSDSNFKFKVRKIDTIKSFLFKGFIDMNLLNEIDPCDNPIYVNCSHSGVQYESIHRKISKKMNLSLIFYLHDLIPIDFPQYFKHKNSSLIHRKRLTTMLKTSGLILVNSEYTKKRLVSYCFLNGYTVPPIEVLKIGVERHFLASEKFRASISSPLLHKVIADRSPLFIAVGTIEPRKNYIFLLRVWKKLMATWRSERLPCPKLVIVGRRGWKFSDYEAYLRENPELKQNVQELNDVSDTGLIQLLNNASGFLMPSFEEGWGIPLSEALTLGVPSICSDIPALRECGQNKAIYLDPNDTNAWLENIKRLAVSTEKGNLDYKPATWDEHFAKLKQIIG